MKTIRFYKVLILILILLNMVTVYSLWNGRGFEGPGHPPRKSLVKVLHLQGSTAKKIAEMEKKHFHDKDALVERSRKLHEELFQSYSKTEKTEKDIEHLIDKIVENQRETEQMTFAYFKEVASLCNAKQKEKLKEVIHHAIGRMGTPPPPRK